MHPITRGGVRHARSLADLAPWALAALVAADLALLALHLTLTLTDRQVGVLDLGHERSLPTWYAATKLFLLAQLLGLVAWLTPAATRRQLLVLLAPAVLFACLSLDEAASLHERLERRTAAWAGGSDEGVLGRAGYWPLLAGLLLGAAMAGLGAAFVRLARPPSAVVLKAGAGAVLILLGAAGIDFLDPLVADPVARVLKKVAEEGFELLGVTVLIWAVLELLAARGSLKAAAP